MKDLCLLPNDHQPSAARLASVSANTNIRTDQTSLPCELQGQIRPGAEDALSNVSATIVMRVPQSEGQSRITRERNERASVEDKIRRAVDSWTAEEQATAYWYLYACGMTLERAKAIRHKGGFHA
jgi:hypothetical protein